MNSCQAVLEHILSDRLSRNTAYSLRSFARDLGLSPASVSSILKGDRGLSPQMAEKVAARLPLTEAERTLFVQMASAQFGRSSKARALASKQLKSKTSLGAIKKLKVSEILLRHWYHLALLEAISDKGFRPTTENLMKRLNLNRMQVELGIKELLAIKAIVPKGKSQYKDNLGNLEVEDTPDSMPLRSFHNQILDVAKRALTEQSSEDLYSQSMIYSVSDDLMPEVRQATRAYIKEISNIVSKSKGKGKIRCLTVQDFKIERE